MPGLANTASVAASLFGLVILYKLAALIITQTLPSRLSRYRHVSHNGDDPWALVTGASNGIGKAFAHELATRGFNVVLHGRNQDKLASVVSQLQATHPHRLFRTVLADASTVPCLNCLPQEEQEQPQARRRTRNSAPSAATAVDFSSLRDAVSDVHLTILINNAGGGLRDPTYAHLSDTSASRVTQNVSLNALFPVHMMREFLPVLRRNGPSLVMNISSMADAGFPLIAPYSASKSFLMQATRAVRLELELDGFADKVEILGVRVGKVAGGGLYNAKVSLFCPDSATMARAALDRVGWGHGLVIGYWAHALQGLGVGLLPTWLGEKAFKAAIAAERADELARLNK